MTAPEPRCARCGWPVTGDPKDGCTETAMARRATSSGEWLNRMSEAVGYTEHAHPADVLQRIDDAVAAESRVRELEAERDPELTGPHRSQWIHAHYGKKKGKKL